MAELEHWIAATHGEDRAKETGFLWLDPRHTGGQGHLWMVVEGVGGAGVGDVVAALATITMTELYPEALDMFRDPLKAMEVAFQDAGRRLDAMRAVYPDLANGRCSFAAVALFNGAYHVAWAGTGRATLVKSGATECVTEDRIKSAKDGVVIPSTGLGSGGPLIHFAGSYELGPHAVALTTHGITRRVREPALGQGVERLAAWGAVPAILTLTRRADERANAAVAVIRAEPRPVKACTTAEAFIEWAESDASTWESKTLVLQTEETAATGSPAVSNYQGLPRISGGASEDEVEDLRESTMSFSPDDVRRIVEGARLQNSDEPGSPDSAGFAFADTTAMQSGDVEAALTGKKQVTNERSGTARESTERAGTGAQDDPAVAPAARTATAGTMMFSPQQLAEVRADAERKFAESPGDGDSAPPHELARHSDTFPTSGSQLQRTRELSDETKLFSPEPRREHFAKEVTDEADEKDTWRGESLSGSLSDLGSRRRGTTALVLLALVIGAVATYFGFFAG